MFSIQFPGPEYVEEGLKIIQAMLPELFEAMRELNASFPGNEGYLVTWFIDPEYIDPPPRVFLSVLTTLSAREADARLQEVYARSKEWGFVLDIEFV